MKLRIVITVILTLCWMSTAQAGFVFYTDKSSFDAVATTTTSDFGTSFVAASPSLVVDGNTYSSTAQVTVCTNAACFGQPFDSPLMTTNSGSNSALRIDLGTPDTAAGGLFGDLDGPTGAGSISLFGAGNVLLDTQAVNYADMGQGLAKTFFGWTTDGGDIITAIEFAAAGSPFAFSAVDDFQFGSAISVPEPSTLGLLGVGLLGLFMRRKRVA